MRGNALTRQTAVTFVCESNSLSVVDYLLTFGHESGFIRDSDCRSLMKHTAGGGD